MSTLIDKEILAADVPLLEATEDTQYEITDMWIHNLAASPTTFDLLIDRENDGVLVRKMSYEVQPDDTLIVTFGSPFTLDNQSKLLGTSSDTADGLSVALMGEVVYRR